MSHSAKPGRGGWIGVDLDGTLCEYDGVWVSPSHIGPPIPAMVKRVQKWLRQGWDVRVFTARVAPSHPTKAVNEARTAIENWCIENIGYILPVTCIKDHKMVELWDDRAVHVVENTGRYMGRSKVEDTVEGVHLAPI